MTDEPRPVNAGVPVWGPDLVAVAAIATTLIAITLSDLTGGGLTGIFVGLLLLAINEFRMKLSRKACIHLGLAFLFPLLSMILLQLSGSGIMPPYPATADHRLLRSLIPLVLTGVAFLYFGFQTVRDRELLSIAGVDSRPGSLLPALAISAVSIFIFPIIFWSLSIHSISVRQNQLLCETLKPGMTLAEVETALSAIDEHQQPTVPDREIWTPETVTELHYLWWAHWETHLKYDSWLYIGYDRHGRLNWIALHMSLEGPPMAVDCPWTWNDRFQQLCLAPSDWFPYDFACP